MSIAQLSDLIPKYTPEQQAERDRQIEEIDRRRAFQTTYQRIANSGIPKEFRDAQTDNTDILAWCENPTSGLLLQGKQGRGKTYKASGALMLLAQSGTIKFATFGDVIRDYESASAMRMSSRSVTIEYTVPYALLIDNLGRDPMNAFTAPKLAEIIDKRLQNKRPTIITTTLTGQGFFDWLASSGNVELARDISSRLKTFTVVPILGEDRRAS